MSNKQHFSYKGYTGSIEFSTDDMCLFGKVQLIRDLIMYDGETLEELKESFELAVDDYLEICEEEGKLPDKPCSGTFNIRMTEELHRRCIHEANSLGLSLNAFVSKCINYYFEETSIKEEFSLINEKHLISRLTELKQYNIIGSGVKDYEYPYSTKARIFEVSKDPLEKYMNKGKGIENV